MKKKMTVWLVILCMIMSCFNSVYAQDSINNGEEQSLDHSAEELPETDYAPDFADDAEESGIEPANASSGTCGENLTWKLNKNGVLTISGEGEMYNYDWGESPFFQNSSILSVVIREGVTNIGWTIFEECSSLKSIDIPDSVTNIGYGAFCECSSLTSINIPQGVTRIEKNAFTGCSSLTSINIPEGVTSIEIAAFTRCSSLVNMIVDRKNTVYDSRDNCNAIIETGTNVLIFGCSSTVIPATAASIGEGAFAYCSGLTSINIPEGVKSIGDGAFYGCSSLTNVNISEGVKKIGGGAFRECSSLVNISIPKGMKSIGEGAFYRCDSLTSIYISKGVKSIGAFAFSGCNSLVSMIVDKKNTVYDSRDNCNAIIETKENRLICGCSSTVIPATVISIGNSAFSGLSSLTSIVITDNVTSIGGGAFYGCSSLTSISIPEGVTSIGGEAFAECRGLTSIWIPSSVTYIGDFAFNYCTSLHVYYPGSKSDRKHIKLGTGNDDLKEAIWHYGKSKTDISSWKVKGIKDLTYTGKALVQNNVRVSSKGKKATVSVEYKNNINVGKATMIITGTGSYSGTIKKTFKILRAKNSVTKVTSGKNISLKKLKKKDQRFTINVSVEENAKLSFKLKSVPKKAEKYISVSKTGKVTVKKGLEKGTYKIMVIITAAKTRNYKKASVTKTVKIVIK